MQSSGQITNPTCDCPGQERQFYGFNLGNVFNRDHSFGYQFTSSSDFELLRAHSVVYEIPLPNRDILTFFGSYAEVSSRIGFPFLQDGFSWQASGRYQHDLPPQCDYEHFITGGFDFKQTNTNLEFNAISFLESTADIAQMTFGYHGRLDRDRSSLAMGADIYISPGEFSPGNFDRDHRRLRAGAEAEYVYSKMYAEMQVPVSCRWTFVGRLTGQISEAPILPVEQLGFGGLCPSECTDQLESQSANQPRSNRHTCLDSIPHRSCRRRRARPQGHSECRFHWQRKRLLRGTNSCRPRPERIGSEDSGISITQQVTVPRPQ